jgi:hypothetical protein
MTTRQESYQEFLNHFVLPHDDLFNFLENSLPLLRHFCDGSNMLRIVQILPWRGHSGLVFCRHYCVLCNVSNNCCSCCALSACPSWP